MNTNKQREPTVIVKGIGTMLHNKYMRLWAQWVETSEESYYILDGKKVTNEEMDSMYPIVELERNAVDKGNRLDSRTNFY